MNELHTFNELQPIEPSERNFKINVANAKDRGRKRICKVRKEHFKKRTCRFERKLNEMGRVLIY